MAGVLIKNLTRRPVAPRAVFSAIAAAILPHSDISLVFVTPAKARALNKKMRGKNYTPNVLSYALHETSCEILICPAEAKKQAGSYGMNERDFLLYLFIHGVLHIKGWVHGATMEKWERTLLARYGTTHSHRHRHRDVPGKSGRRRRARR